jgi:choline-sulfatase
MMQEHRLGRNVLLLIGSLAALVFLTNCNRERTGRKTLSDVVPAGYRKLLSLGQAARDGAETVLETDSLDLGRSAASRFLVEGFYEREQVEGTWLAWSRGPVSTVRLFLGPDPAPRVLRVWCRPFSHPSLPAQKMSVFVNGRPIGTWELSAKENRLERPVPKQDLRPGWNSVSFRYAYAVRPRDLIPGSLDERELAVMFSRIGLENTGRRPGTGERPRTWINYYVEVPQEAFLSFGFKKDGAANPGSSNGGDTLHQEMFILSEDGDQWAEDFGQNTGKTGRGETGTVSLARFGGKLVQLSFGANPPPGGQTRSLARLGYAGAAIWGKPEDAAPETGGPAPPAPPVPADRPNVIFYIMDALRPSNLHCYGAGIENAPSLDRIAAGGVRFRSAFSQAPNTPPSVKSFMTSRYLPFTGERKIPEAVPTMAEIFRSAGYRTGLFPGSPYISTEMGLTRGFDTIAKEDYFNEKESLSKTNAGRIAKSLCRWIDERGDGGRPFFAYAHAMHPHNPYSPPEPFREKFLEGKEPRIDGRTSTLLDLKHGKRKFLNGDIEQLRALYDADILYDDSTIGRIMDFLSRKHLDRDTIFVLSADHGEELLDHGGLLHGYTLYDELVHVPLLLRYPARFPAGGRVVESPVRLIDILPTILELAGIPAPEGFEGKSLVALLAGGNPQEAQEDIFFSASCVPGLFGVRSGNWKYVFAPRTDRGVIDHNEMGMGDGIGHTASLDYLFDLKNDPGERSNLACENPVRMHYLKEKVYRWVEGCQYGARSAREAPASAGGETRKTLESLGYTTRGREPEGGDFRMPER